MRSSTVFLPGISRGCWEVDSEDSPATASTVWSAEVEGGDGGMLLLVLLVLLDLLEEAPIAPVLGAMGGKEDYFWVCGSRR